jgi:hypothetical protein
LEKVINEAIFNVITDIYFKIKTAVLGAKKHLTRISQPTNNQ